MKGAQVAWLVGLMILGVFASTGRGAEGKQRLYFGTYGHGKGQGIFMAELDPATGTVSEPRLAGEAVHPSFLAIHPTRRFLYAVSEVEEGRRKMGGVIAFAVDPASGMLKRLNGQPSQGGGPCHLVVDEAGKNVLV